MRKRLSLVFVFVLLSASAVFGAPGSGSAVAVETFVFGEDLGGIAHMSRGPRIATSSVSNGGWEDSAEVFARGFATRLGGVGTESFAARRVIADELGQVHIRMTQSIAGLTVVGAELIVHADVKTGAVVGVNGRFVPDQRLPRTAEIGANEALERAMEQLGLEAAEIVGVPELTYIATDDGAVYLAWTNLIAYASNQGLEIDRAFVDAVSGSLVAVHPQIHRAKYRKTYDAKNGTSLPGTLLFSEGGSSSDTTAMAAYNNGGTTYDYYKGRHNRDSFDNAGATITQTVHYSTNYNNAFWNGSQMVYGDGDGTTFAPLARALDVVAHELTHAVTQYEANLTYKNESGALNEAMSDVFGAGTEAYKDGGVNSDTWKIGEDVYTPGTSGDALRYMDDPAKGGDYDYYPTRYVGTSDNGGVHWNSGIANLAFKLLTTGGSHPRSKTSVSVTGIGIGQAEKIYYRALTIYLTSSSNFRHARAHTLRAASDLYGSSSTAYSSVGKSWDAVGNNWTTQTGSITSSGGTHYQPYYLTSTAGYQTGHMFGPSGTDYDLYLQKWDGSKWVTVASGTTSSKNEVVQYNGAAAYYRWYVKSYSGTGSYTLYSNRPK